ncbi:NAD(P)H-dependent oxidoreductase [Bacillus testis]|uniref:NAD(P)H-dependent oxidoreductase n=1 Tax=Bacillus testis TaxID=1622072 RepID=UPI00067EA416|nr:NAD(P)H-dependent oxidoreductase [Bacillus testis]
MKHLIVFAHPSQDSFNGAILKTICTQLQNQGQPVEIRDLYRLSFSPVLTQDEIRGFKELSYSKDIAKEQDYIDWADVLYFIYPTWWYAAPAILKGYFDRVLSSGFAFQSTLEGPAGLLKGKKAFVIETAGDTEKSLAIRGLSENMRHTIDQGILGYCGIEVVQHFILAGIHDLSNEERQLHLDKISGTIASFCMT